MPIFLQLLLPTVLYSTFILGENLDIAGSKRHVVYISQHHVGKPKLVKRWTGINFDAVLSVLSASLMLNYFSKSYHLAITNEVYVQLLP